MFSIESFERKVWKISKIFYRRYYFNQCFFVEINKVNDWTPFYAKRTQSVTKKSNCENTQYQSASSPEVFLWTKKYQKNYQKKKSQIVKKSKKRTLTTKLYHCTSDMWTASKPDAPFCSEGFHCLLEHFLVPTICAHNAFVPSLIQ